MKPRNIIFSSVLSLSLLSAPAYGAAFDTGPRADTLFVTSEGTPEQVRTMANLFASSAGYGIWSNKVLNGSGNNSMLPKKPQPEGYFSQMLRSLSLFDLYFTAGVLRMQSKMKGADQASLLVAGGSLSEDFVKKQPEPKMDFLGQGISMGFMDLGPFARFSVRQMPEDAAKFVKGDAQFPATIFRKEFNQGLAFRYWNLKEKADRSNGNVIEKILSQNALFWPLGFMGSLHVEPKAKNATKARYLMLMAAPGELKTPERDPRTWEIVTVEKDLDKALETEFATVSKVVYEGAGRQQRDNLSLLQIETQKDFNRPSELDVVMSFGHQSSSDGDTITGMSYKLPNESLRMRGHLRLRELEQSKVGDWKVVKKVTDFIRTFNVEVGFHQLGLTMIRPNIRGTAKEVFEANPTFSLKYNPKNSLLSYRIYKYVPGDEAASLKKIGFTCSQRTPSEQYCERMFWSAKEVAQGFFADFNKGVMANIFSKILGKVTKDAFKEELPEVTSEVNEALAGMVLKLIEDGQKAKAMTSQLLPNSPMNPASFLMMNK